MAASSHWARFLGRDLENQKRQVAVGKFWASQSLSQSGAGLRTLSHPHLEPSLAQSITRQAAAGDVSCSQTESPSVFALSL